MINIGGRAQSRGPGGRKPGIPGQSMRNSGPSSAQRMALAQTRPELAAVFSASSAAAAEPSTATAQTESDAPASSSAAAPSQVSLAGLPPGIANISANDEQTKVLAGWILEQSRNLPDDALNSLELEFKMGLITDERGGRRHAFTSECALDPAFFKEQRLRFKSDVGAAQFASLEKVLDEVMAANAAASENALTRAAVELRDARYVVEYAPLGPGKQSVRVTSDTQGRVLECQAKQRIGDVHVALPHSEYDLKMSLSLEQPVDAESFMPRVKHLRPRFERDKSRLKWTAVGCEIDLTSVRGREGGGAAQATKEVEIETHTQLLASALREHRATPSRESLDKFLEIIRYTTDSARYLSHSI